MLSLYCKAVSEVCYEVEITCVVFPFKLRPHSIQFPKTIICFQNDTAQILLSKFSNQTHCCLQWSLRQAFLYQYQYVIWFLQTRHNKFGNKNGVLYSKFVLAGSLNTYFIIGLPFTWLMTKMIDICTFYTTQTVPKAHSQNFRDFIRVLIILHRRCLWQGSWSHCC